MAPVTYENLVVFGKEGCARCEEVKSALEAHNIIYSYEDVRFLNDPVYNPDWRNNGAVDLLADINMLEWNGDLPVVRVGDKFVLAADASELVVDGMSISIERNEHCEDGACKIDFNAPVMEEAVA